MKNYFILFAVIVLVLFSSLTYLIFRMSAANLEIIDNNSEKMMLRAADFFLENTNISKLALYDESAEEYKNAIENCAYMDFFTNSERVTLIDEFSNVLVSSSELFKPGDNFGAYLIFPEMLDSLAAENAWGFTPSKQIQGVCFRSLYYPVRSGGSVYFLIMDSDRTYFKTVMDTRRDSVILAVVQIFIFFGVLGMAFLMMLKYSEGQRKLHEQKNLAFIGRTASELAHELKNPLAIIKSSADIMRRKFDPEKIDKTFEFMSSEIMRMSRTMDNILNFAKDRPLDMKWLDIGSILDPIVSGAGLRWPDLKIVTHSAYQGEIFADEDSLKQLIWNIIKNSSEAVSGKGHLEIRLKQKDNGPFLVFSDDGPGIPEKYAGKIFEPFVTTRKKGTGLGLAVCSEICRKHGWSMESYNGERGAVFKVNMEDGKWRKS